MKYFRLLILCFIIISLCLLCSCSTDEALDTPLGVEVEYDTLTLKWKAVEGAKVYTVRIEPEGKEPYEVSVSKNNYQLEPLEEGKYSITVKATDNSGRFLDSELSLPLEFIREKETGLSFKLINGGTEYEVSDKGSATGVIEIPETYRKKPVTAIGTKAFFNKSDVIEVKLPQSISKIGDFAFANCSYLTKINLPEGLTHLGESAFSGCRILGGRLDLPDSLSAIPDGAFAYCSSLTEIDFGTGVESIGKNAFTDCSDLEALVFPPQLKELGDFAFAACADVTSVSFNEGLVCIGEFVFSKVMLLNSVALPNSLKSIGSGAFYHCSALVEISLGDAVEVIGASAFLDTPIYTSSLTNEIYVGNWFIGLRDDTVSRIEIKAGTLGIANNALFGNKYIRSVELPNTVERIGSLAFAGSQIVSIVTGSGVTCIADQAFLSCDQLVTALLGSYDSTTGMIKDSSLESIGSYAFMNCSRIERIEIPESVKDIGSYAFRNTGIFNNALTGVVYADNWLVDFNDNITNEVSVYSGTKGIARYAFYNCGILTNITIPNTVKVIGRGAFYNCTALESVILPDTLERIEDYTFYCCGKLRLTLLPPMLREIGRSAFYKCSTVKDYNTDTDNDMLQIPSGVTYIGDFAFYGCGYRQVDGLDGETETGGIDILIIGDSVEYIGRCAFYGFASLKSVTVGGTAMIGEKAFYKCESLEEITVSTALVSVGDMAFYRCDSLIRVILPDTLERIGDYAFFKCGSLKEVKLGKGLLRIGDFAFFANKLLENVYIPSAVTEIGEQAFRDCDAITSIVLGSSVSFIGDHAFYSCDTLTIYTEHTTIPSSFSKNWNSTFCPLILGCELTLDSEYVASVTANEGFIVNNFTDTVLSDPMRMGYIFVGWSASPLSDEANYYACDLAALPSGIKIYSVWIED